MPSVTYDGRSFQIDGRRLWIVSGSVHYARVPREHWEERIALAKQAGLNTIETPVFWNRHEPRPGHFDFTGDNDLRHFVQLVGQAGMYCILRPGPYVGQEWDFGGLPPWVNALKDVRLRGASGTFLEACSRYLSAVADRVRDLQITSPGKAGPGGIGGGPILLVQSESQWFCGDDRQAELYLSELNRYLREAGFTVPIINANNLWAGGEGEIECWTGSGDLLATVRQLAAVRPDRPRIVIEFDVAEQSTWGDVPAPAMPVATVEQRLAQVLAAGGQFNLHPFHGGTNFGFWGGRLGEVALAGGGYATPSRDLGAPLSESGAPGPNYAAVRRVCTFASRFARVFANLEPSYRPVVAAPVTQTLPRLATKKGEDHAPMPPSVVHTTGTQGSIAFVFGQPSEGDQAGQAVELLLPGGTTMPVEIGLDGVTWCVFDAFLGGRAKLDYCSVSAFAVVGKVLVIFGRPGAEARLSINGSPLQAEIPRPKSGVGLPELVQHEGCVVVVATREQLEQIHLTDEAVYVGAAGLNASMQPLALAGTKNCTKVTADGEVSVVHAVHAAHGSRSRGGDKIAMTDWLFAGSKDYCDGSSPRYAAIDGPADLATLGCPYGYGWYRCKLKPGSTGKTAAIFPAASDRLHVFAEGDDVGLVGRGPGASMELTLPLKKNATTLVVLAENLGRVSSGLALGEPKGLYGHIWESSPIKMPKPFVKNGEPIEILTFKTPVWGVQDDDVTMPDRVTWTLQHRKKNAVVMAIASMPERAMLVLNEKPVALLDRGGPQHVTIAADQLKAGANLVQLALLPDATSVGPEAVAEHLSKGVVFHDAIDCVTEKAEWAFARWEPPRASAFQKHKSGKLTGPTWWRTTFRPTDAHTPLYLDLTGLTKGQVYVNGKHIGRYFVATPDGKPVPPGVMPMVPGAWLRAGDENELLIFDEHGGNPGKVHFVSERSHA